MCVLYVSFGSKIRSRTFGCIAMCSAVLFTLRSRWLVYSIGSGINRVQVALSEFSVLSRQKLSISMVICICLLHL